MKETITIEKEVFEAVLRNSVKVADLEAENMQLKELLIDFTKRMEHYKEVKPDVGFIMFDLGYLANQVKEVLK